MADGSYSNRLPAVMPGPRHCLRRHERSRSRVQAALKDPRRYRVLEELNFRPVVAYPRVVRNRAAEKGEEGESTWLMSSPLSGRRSSTGGQIARGCDPRICGPMDCRPTALWWALFTVPLTALLVGVAAVWYQIATGIGTWGLNKTVGWAFDITNFVFWVGIGHAGTLISAVLFLFRQKWPLPLIDRRRR